MGNIFIAFLSLVTSKSDDLERYSLVRVVVESTSQIPIKYANYANIFLEEGAIALLRDARVEYYIKIKEGK